MTFAVVTLVTSFFNKGRTILLSGVTMVVVLRLLLSPSSAGPIAAKTSTVYFLLSGTTNASRAIGFVKRYKKFLKTARKCRRAGRVGLNHSVAVNRGICQQQELKIRNGTGGD